MTETQVGPSSVPQTKLMMARPQFQTEEDRQEMRLVETRTTQQTTPYYIYDDNDIGDIGEFTGVSGERNEEGSLSLREPVWVYCGNEL